MNLSDTPLRYPGTDIEPATSDMTLMNLAIDMSYPPGPPAEWSYIYAQLEAGLSDSEFQDHLMRRMLPGERRWYLANREALEDLIRTARAHPTLGAALARQKLSPAERLALVRDMNIRHKRMSMTKEAKAKRAKRRADRLRPSTTKPKDPPKESPLPERELDPVTHAVKEAQKFDRFQLREGLSLAGGERGIETAADLANLQRAQDAYLLGSPDDEDEPEPPSEPKHRPPGRPLEEAARSLHDTSVELVTSDRQTTLPEFGVANPLEGEATAHEPSRPPATHQATLDEYATPQSAEPPGPFPSTARSERQTSLDEFSSPRPAETASAQSKTSTTQPGTAHQTTMDMYTQHGFQEGVAPEFGREQQGRLTPYIGNDVQNGVAPDFTASGSTEVQTTLHSYAQPGLRGLGTDPEINDAINAARQGHATSSPDPGAVVQSTLPQFDQHGFFNDLADLAAGFTQQQTQLKQFGDTPSWEPPHHNLNGVGGNDVGVQTTLHQFNEPRGPYKQPSSGTASFDDPLMAFMPMGTPII